MFPLPASARIDTLLLGCTHYPLLRPVIAAVAGEGVAIVDSATATASALAELLAINGLEAPARRDSAAPATTSSSRPATSTRSGPSPGGCSARRSPTSTGSSFPGAGGRRRPWCRRSHDRRWRGDPAKPRPREAALARRPASGRPGSSSARRSARRRPSSAGAPSGRPGAGLVDWPARRADRDRPPPGGAGRADARPSCGPPSRDYAAAMARIVPRLSAGARDGAAGRRRAIGASSTGPAGSARTSRRSRR